MICPETSQFESEVLWFLKWVFPSAIMANGHQQTSPEYIYLQYSWDCEVAIIAI